MYEERKERIVQQSDTHTHGAILKKKEAITLIALVITIVVMIILAGVAINLTLGDSGIFNKAKEAKIMTLKARYFEEINLQIIEEQTERMEQTKEEVFILSLKNRLQVKSWVEDIIMCDENNDYNEETYLNTVLIVTTTDGFEIIIDVYNNDLYAVIRNEFIKAKNKVEVRYDANGGNGEAPGAQYIRSGFKIVTQANTFNKDNYEFAGWDTKADGTGERLAQNSEYRITENTVLYAIWKQNVITISFDSNGGTGSMSNINVEENKSIKLTQNTFTRNGYRFNKWNTKADGTGTDYQNNEIVTLNENTTLYAQWLNSYRVTLTAGNNIISVGQGKENGTYVPGEQVTVTCSIKENYTDSGYTISGDVKFKYYHSYTFSGWSGTSNSSEQTYTFIMPERNVNLTATATETLTETDRRNALGNKKDDLLLVGTGYSITQGVFDVKTIYSNYQTLTVDNFVLDYVGCYQETYSGQTKQRASINKNYDASTGIFTVSIWDEWATGALTGFIYDVYIISNRTGWVSVDCTDSTNAYGWCNLAWTHNNVIKDIYDDYENLTEENFLLEPMTTSYRGGSSNNIYSVNLEYNPSTGTLTINRCSAFVNGEEHYPFCKLWIIPN